MVSLDPAIAMKIVVDLVRGEGVAKGKPWPMFLQLGEDSETALRAKFQKMIASADAWTEVTRSTDHTEF